MRIYLLVSQDQAKVIILILNCTSIYLIKLFNLIKNQQKDTGKSYLYAKDSFKPKNQLLFNWKEKVEDKELKNPKITILFFLNNCWCLIKFEKTTI